MEQQARGELGEEVRALLRHRLAAARDGPDILDAGRPQQESRLRLAAVDGRDGFVAARCVRDSLRRKAVDDFDVERVTLEQLVAPATVEDDAGQLLAGLVDRRSARA